MRTTLSILVAVGTGVVAWLLGNNLFSRQFVSLLDNTGIVLGDFLAIFGIFAGFLAWIERRKIRLWFLKTKFEDVGEQFNMPVDAMVIPVSPRVEQPEWILRHLRPKFVSFLYTDASQSTAQQITGNKEFSDIEFFPDADQIKNKKYIISNPNDPQESKTLTSMFIDHFLAKQIEMDKIFVDTTAGKVPMSIGAFQAAEEKAVSTVYIVGTKNGLIKDPKNRGDGKPIFISNKTT